VIEIEAADCAEDHPFTADRSRRREKISAGSEFEIPIEEEGYKN